MWGGGGGGGAVDRRERQWIGRRKGGTGEKERRGEKGRREERGEGKVGEGGRGS